MRKYLFSSVRTLLTSKEKTRIDAIRKPFTMTYSQVLKALEQEAQEVGITELIERLDNEAVILVELKEKQEALFKKADAMVLERIVKLQAQGYNVDKAIEETPRELAKQGLDNKSLEPLNEQVSGLNVRQILLPLERRRVLAALKDEAVRREYLNRQFASFNEEETHHNSLHSNKS